jgi:two-component sensor histidine kinase
MRYFYLFLLSLLIACAKAPQKETPLPPQLANPYLKQPSEKALYTFVKKLTLADGLSSNNIQQIFKDSKGFIWIATDNGLNRYDGLTIKNYWHDSDDANSILDNDIIDIAEDSLGNILVLTQKGVNWIQPNQVMHAYTQPDWAFFFYKHKVRAIFTAVDLRDSLPPYYCTLWVKDSKNNFWSIGMKDLKTIKVDTSIFKSYYKLNSYLCQIWKFGLSITIDNNDEIQFQKANSDLLSICNQDSSRLKGIVDAFIDQNHLNDLLLGRDNFKYLFAPNDLKPTNILLERNNIWIGTSTGVIHYSNQVSLFNNNISIAPSQSVAQVAGINDSILKLDGTGSPFFKDSQNRIWMGRDIGLYQIIDTTKGTRMLYAQQAGFQHPQIKSIQEDAHGQLWISTGSGGIAVFSPQLGRVIKTFTEEDGLPTQYFDSDVSTKHANGCLRFGTENGVVYFHPDSLYRNAEPPNVAITSVTANEVEKYSPSPKKYTFTLPYDSNSLIITPRVLNLTQPHRNKIRYKLEGVDADYCKPLAVKDLHYPHLAAGDYTLLIQGANSHGVWNPIPTRCHITILPAWWQTWWFRILVGGFLIVLSSRFFYMWQRYTNQKHQRETDALQARVLQVQLNPHFIFNVLNLVQGKIMNESPQTAGALLVRLSRLLRNFLDSSVLSSYESGKFQEINLEKEIELLKDYIMFEQLKNDNRFQFDLNIADDIEPSDEKFPPFFIQPYVENAIKHGLLYRNDAQGILTITFDKKVEQGNSYLVCTVSDNGVGIKRAQEIQKKDPYVHKSLGGELVEKRRKILNLYHYDIQIKQYDQEPSGTKIVIQFKKKV